MKKNKKGFTLLELLIVVLITGILAGVGIPMYMNTVNKTRVSINLPLMRSLQSDIVMYYNMNNTLPTKLSQLSLNLTEFTNVTDTSATQISTGCVFELKTNESGYAKIVTQDCGKGWVMWYTVKSSSLGYSADKRIFKITANTTTNAAVAKNFGWTVGSNPHEYLIM